MSKPSSIIPAALLLATVLAGCGTPDAPSGPRFGPREILIDELRLDIPKKEFSSYTNNYTQFDIDERSEVAYTLEKNDGGDVDSCIIKESQKPSWDADDEDPQGVACAKNVSESAQEETTLSSGRYFVAVRCRNLVTHCAFTLDVTARTYLEEDP